jgi:predicted RNA-binding Zn ribbon-like protein
VTGPELVGNALCLDFANTVNRRPDPDRDWLAEPDGLRRWAHHAGLAMRRSVVGLEAACKLREAVYRTFHAVAGGRKPAADDLGVITATYADGLEAARLVPGSTTYGLEWPQPASDRRVLWAVADSAVELLRHGPLDRVGECPSCGWLFLDTSRNGRRRWCSMAMCGNRVKSARHYASRSGAGSR